MKNSFGNLLIVLGLLVGNLTVAQEPLRLAVAGVSHGHNVFVLNRKLTAGFKLVGVYDADQLLVTRLSNQFKFSPDLIYTDLEKMLDEVRPDAVVAFGSVYDHLAVVEAAAPRGIHVMVEKPLATTVEHAERMVELATKHKIQLLTNYETSWYPSISELFKLVENNFTGRVRKVVVNAGHQGPVEIGCDPYFLAWLTDPVLNGAGALFDFGCYGANLVTALAKENKPVSVTAITRRYKPHIYPLVDDDATILVSYADFDCVIQASWNWTFNRKDIEVYGTEGSLIAVDSKTLRQRKSPRAPEEIRVVHVAETQVYEDPFSCFYDVITKKTVLTPFSPYTLENNLMVVRILDAARKSANSGTTWVF